MAEIATTTPRISICEWIFGDRPLAETARIVRGAGYDALELAGEPKRPDRAGLPHLLEGLAVTGLSAMGKWPTDERDLTHSEPGARRRAVEYYRSLVELALEVGAPTVSVVPTASGRFKALTRHRQEWSFAIEGLREIANFAGERGVALAIEPLNRYETHLVNRVEQAMALIDDIGVPGLGIVADVFHMQLEEADPVSAIERAGDRLRAVHLADSNRRGLGHGTLDVGPVVERAIELGSASAFVMEFLAPGPDPWEPNKDAEAMEMLGVYADESAARVRQIVDAFGPGVRSMARRKGGQRSEPRPVH